MRLTMFKTSNNFLPTNVPNILMKKIIEVWISYLLQVVIQLNHSTGTSRITTHRLIVTGVNKRDPLQAICIYLVINSHTQLVSPSSQALKKNSTVYPYLFPCHPLEYERLFNRINFATQLICNIHETCFWLAT